jgi:mannosyltransferase
LEIRSEYSRRYSIKQAMVNLFNKDLSFRFVYQHKTALIVLSILIFALALRLYNLNKYDLWFDELASSSYSHQNLDGIASYAGLSVASVMFERFLNDPHPPLYYLLIYISSFFLKTDQSLRLISVVFSTFSLLILYKLARRMYDRPTAIITLLLMAMNPFQLWYAQEIRAYAMSVFFSLLATYLLIKIIQGEKGVFWLYFFIAESFAILTNYYSVLLFMIAAGFLCFKRGLSCFKKMCAFIIIALVGCIPFWGFIAPHLYIVKNSFWLMPPGLKSLFLSFAVFGLGYSANYPQLIFGTACLAALFIYGVYKSIKDKNKYAVFLSLSFLLPIIIIFAVSKSVIPVYIDRQFIIITPFYYLLIAHGISRIKDVTLKFSVCFIVMALMVSLFINYNNGFMLVSGKRREFYPGVHVKKQYGALMGYLRDNLDKEDIIAATDLQSYVLTTRVMREKFNNSGAHWLLFSPVTLTDVEKNTYPVLRDIGNGTDRIGQTGMYAFYFVAGRQVFEKEPLVNKTVKRIWLVTSFWDKLGLSPVNNAYKRIRMRLRDDYRCEEVKEADGIMIEKLAKNNL